MTKQVKDIHSLGGSNFLITIHHSENNSWQGVINWLDTGKTIHFRSALEMMSLIDEAVARDKRSWEDIKTTKAV